MREAEGPLRRTMPGKPALASLVVASNWSKVAPSVASANSHLICGAARSTDYHADGLACMTQGASCMNPR